MKRINYVLAIIILLSLIFSLITGCKKGVTPTSGKPTASSATKAKSTQKSSATTTKASTVAVNPASVGSGNADDQNTSVSGEGPGSDSGDVIEESGSDISISKHDGVINLEGRTIKIHDMWFKDAENNNMLGREGVNLFNDALLSSIRDAEKKYNCQIIYGNYDIGGAITTVFAQNAVAGLKQPFDAFSYSIREQLVTWVNSNIIAPLDDYINLDAPEVKEVPYGSVANLGQYKGKQWVYPHPAHAVYPSATYNYMYNRRLLNASAIPDLQDIEAQGQWNWDKLAEISRALTLDFNGDNIIDQYAISVNYATFISSMIFSNGGRYFKEVDGKYLLTLTENKTLMGINFASKLFNNDQVVDPVGFLSGNPYTRFINGADAMFIDGVWQMKNIKASTLKDDIGFVCLPVGPDFRKGIDSLNVNTAGKMFFFPETTLDKEKVVPVICDALSMWYSEKPYNKGKKLNPIIRLEGTPLNERDLNYLDNMPSEAINTNMAMIPNFTSTITSKISGVFKQEYSLSTAVDSVKSQLQQILDSFQ